MEQKKDEIHQIIARVPAWKVAREVQIEHIAGLTNANYRLTVDGECYVLRVSGANTERLGINRSHEFAALQAAAAAGIGPEVVAFLPPEGHLVTRWIDGYHWKASEYRTLEHVCLLTETVKHIHALPPTEASFSPFRRVETYQDTARRSRVPLPPAFDNYLETMHAVENDQKSDPSDWLHFCHNDLVSVNYLFIEKEQSIKVIDWEFSGLGDIYYDLATVVYTHDNVGPIPPDLENAMLACYFGTITDFHRKRLLGMKYMLMLFTGLWGLAQYGIQQQGLLPSVEGFDYQKFSEYLFAHDIKKLQEQYQLLLSL